MSFFAWPCVLLGATAKNGLRNLCSDGNSWGGVTRAGLTAWPQCRITGAVGGSRIGQGLLLRAHGSLAVREGLNNGKYFDHIHSRAGTNIVSDNVCPWCFVGKRNMESAMKTFAASQPADSPPSFEVSWKPFFLNVDSPETSEENIGVYLEKKYGPGAGSRMSAALGRAGALTGIRFNAERRVHNTMRSHRLVRLATKQGKGNEMIEQIFHGYFEEGRNIADVGVLLDLAEKAGVECTREYLEGKEGAEEVMLEYETGARKHGISGVPFFLVVREGSKASIPLSGAQSPDTFVEAFEALSS